MATASLAPINFLTADMFDKLTFDWAGFEPFPSHFLGVSSFDASDSDKVRTYLNWDALFRKWEIPVPFPQVLDDPEWGAEARNLFHDANILLNDFLQKGHLRADVVFGVWRASAEGNQVLIQPGRNDAPVDSPDGQLPVRVSFPRLPLSGESAYCLADFIKPARAMPSGESDYIGGYAIRLDAANPDRGIPEQIRQWESRKDDYRALLATDLCELYRSAVADYLHYRIRRFIWAYCDDDDLSNEEVMEGLHQGIRVEIGGPECPDLTVKTPLLQLLGSDGQSFARNDAAGSASSECGFFFAHPKSRPYPLTPTTNQSVPSL